MQSLHLIFCRCCFLSTESFYGMDFCFFSVICVKISSNLHWLQKPSLSVASLLPHLLQCIWSSSPSELFSLADFSKRTILDISIPYSTIPQLDTSLLWRKVPYFRVLCMHAQTFDQNRFNWKWKDKENMCLQFYLWFSYCRVGYCSYENYCNNYEDIHQVSYAT